MQQQGPGPNDTRNVIIAIALSLAIMLGWEFFYNMPQRERLEAERARVEATQPAPAAGQRTGETPNADATPAAQDREQVLSQSAAQRIVIDTASVDGTLSLEGARFDDLNLRNYRRTLEPNSPEATLLIPYGAAHGHDAFFGWELRQGEGSAPLADSTSLWRAPEGARLTPASPVTLTRDAGNGVTIERTIGIDEDYMFTITDTVRNASAAPVSVRPFGTVRRRGLPEDFRVQSIVHQGLIGVFGPSGRSYHQENFRDADKHARDRVRGRVGEAETILEQQGQGGWLGITDHYWLSAIVPDQSEQISAYYDARTDDNTNSYRAAYRGQWREAPAGGEITYTQRFFAGAKRVDVLRGYETNFSIPRFDDAVDWGMFWFLTRPFFSLLSFFANWVGSFGFAILLSTIVIKAVLFPLVYQSFKSMAKMRAIAPKMKEVQERYAADKARQQQEIMKLYQTEKVNPVSGCLPILLQIPVFYALYKVLSVTIEMRHAPFVGWIRDLSAPDPTSIFNLFGLLPYDPAAIPVIGLFLGIGAWPILYGISMWALQALSPPPPDPIQRQVFAILPLVFTFMFAGFPAGMVIYWTWSNTLSILQQYVIMRRQGVETQFDKLMKKWLSGKSDDGESGGGGSGTKRVTAPAK